jgi:HSP20 family protein
MTFYVQPYPMTRRWVRPVTAEEAPRLLAVNVREEETAFVITALTPGLKADDLNIQVLEDVVRIEGEFKHGEGEYALRELSDGPFRRVLRLPSAVQADKAEARITDGVLSLSLPKAKEALPKKIKIVAK